MKSAMWSIGVALAFMVGVQSVPDPRIPRVLPNLGLINVVQFPNDPCPGSGAENGTCYTTSECQSRNGIASGTCAGGYGVCCVLIGGCGTTVSENGTYFQGTASNSGSCSYKICRASNSICQIRLNYEMFVINGPDVASDSTFLTLNGNQVEMSGGGSSLASNCLTDMFMVTTPNGPSKTVLCGTNNGYHEYFEAGEGCTTLNFQFTGTGSRMWKIRTEQIDCESEVLAPPGCSQFIYGAPAEAGIVETFNFVGGQHLANQNQNICIRREKNNCRLCFFAATGTDFAVSGAAGVPPALGVGSVANCCGYGADGAGILGFDCVTIPGARNKDNVLVSPKICGRDNGLVTGASPMVSQSICTTSNPFSIRFISDGFEFAGTTASEAGVANVGFKLNYLQDTPCAA
eukprot:maker-scaffold305_size215425-snap-gene-1.13 protein:Tk09430 transcript:maker-scaffold305_size215425-snap-gene-1.13-mRNA-1 annotation:"PREDICTED: uncharacterized protein LOC101744434"